MTVFWIARGGGKTDTYGAIGAALALLLCRSYLLGRLITASAVINATLWQRREDRAERRAERAHARRVPGSAAPQVTLRPLDRVRAEHRLAQEGHRWPSRAKQLTRHKRITARGPAKLPLWRRIIVSVLVVLVCVLAPISVLGVWVRNTVLHTDQYVDTMAPLASDLRCEDAISTRVTNTLVEETNLEDRIAAALPTRAKRLAPVILGGAEQIVHGDPQDRAVDDPALDALVFQSERASDLPNPAIGDDDRHLVVTNYRSFTASDVYLIDRGEERRSRVAAPDPGHPLRGLVVGLDKPIVLFSSEDLRKVQGGTSLLNDLGNYLPFVVLALLVAAILLSGTDAARSSVPRSGSPLRWRCC